jgi:hypothetical protein
VVERRGFLFLVFKTMIELRELWSKGDGFSSIEPGVEEKASPFDHDSLSSIIVLKIGKPEPTGFTGSMVGRFGPVNKQNRSVGL